ncbi:ring-opening amidohydrolase [Cohnella hashimotonis]|uniref:Cyanuric acid amidohydrolase n=1 Tax=Cohnella hashimotonis TaxID=2826895 RepID=A0ABT6TGC1_9BACL|nr:ring-opening amidohydrolase [Cohnella hashimotonis]MDI4645883.1 ring-opening amidohydrolase [Cohnella hashimotonis]
MNISVVRVPAASPSDIGSLRAYIEEGRIHPSQVIAVLGKTEGNGCVNDFTRGYAVQSLRGFFAGLIGAEAADRISFIMSGGTEGVLAPHFTVISRSETSETATASIGSKSLAVGVAHTRRFLPEELGRSAQIVEVSAAVSRAMAEARIEAAADVHFVQIKCPLLTDTDMANARARGAEVAVDDTYKSMGYSRGASALGAAVALGEIDLAEISDEDVCQSWDKYSEVASTSSGSELDYCEVIVFGNSAQASGDLYMSHGVMADAIDAKPLLAMLADNPGAEVVQVLAKAEADPTGLVRGRRHTMLNDSDINHTRHARAAVGAVLASIVGDPMIYVSGGAEHQGPAGGGPVAVIFRRANA